MSETILLTNATLVLRDQVLKGTLLLRDGRIVEIQPGFTQAAGAIDFSGDYLIPGVIDVHTDNLERQVQPRTTARWPSRSALLTHDQQCVGAGVTTVLDALCLGNLGFEPGRIQTFLDGMADIETLTPLDLLKAEHFLHLRCEVPAPDLLELLEPVAEHPLVRMVSLMDHTPGFGQYADLDRYRYLRRREGQTEAAVEERIRHTQSQRARYRDPQRRRVLELVGHRGLALASHDDRTEAEIAENAADGIRISEFPVTLAAARAARAHDMQVVAGAPNIVRGGSHSGNISVSELIRADAVDVLASDYFPSSLVEAAFAIAAAGDISLPDAVALVTDRPARMVGLPDRGRIEVGMQADLVRVRPHEGLTAIREVYRRGERVA
jgi:alpha-D-ribose 1-methylphosphonate 5-triphosphate diphosphatase